MQPLIRVCGSVRTATYPQPHVGCMHGLVGACGLLYAFVEEIMRKLRLTASGLVINCDYLTDKPHLLFTQRRSGIPEMPN